MAKLPFKSGAFEKLGLGAIGISGAFDLGLDIYSSVGDYKDARENGATRVGAFAESAGTFALYRALNIPTTIALQTLPAIPKLAVKGFETVGKLTRQMNQQGKQVPFVNTNFNDYAQAFTMRQAGMQMELVFLVDSFVLSIYQLFQILLQLI